MFPQGAFKMKKKATFAWLIPATFLVLGAAPAADVEDWLRRGNDAFHREQYKEALEWFQKAAERGTEPGLIAYNQAVAHYHLNQYRDAELSFSRCLTDATGARQAQALYGLGNSLLFQAGVTDVKLYQEAIRCYQLCRQHKDLPTDLRDPVKHNLELARLRLAKALVEAAKNPNAGNPDPQKSPQKNGSDSTENPDGLNKNQSDSSNPNKDKMQPGEPGDLTESAKMVPMRGKPPVIPDTDKLVSIPAEDTARYLQEVTERIWHDSQSARNKMSNPFPGVKDW
jgi:tetratricopeptide (TPR) repeat protein